MLLTSQKSVSSILLLEFFAFPETRCDTLSHLNLLPSFSLLVFHYLRWTDLIWSPKHFNNALWHWKRKEKKMLAVRSHLPYAPRHNLGRSRGWSLLSSAGHVPDEVTQICGKSFFRVSMGSWRRLEQLWMRSVGAVLRWCYLKKKKWAVHVCVELRCCDEASSVLEILLYMHVCMCVCVCVCRITRRNALNYHGHLSSPGEEAETGEGCREVCQRPATSHLSCHPRYASHGIRCAASAGQSWRLTQWTAQTQAFHSLTNLCVDMQNPTPLTSVQILRANMERGRWRGRNLG